MSNRNESRADGIRHLLDILKESVEQDTDTTEEVVEGVEEADEETVEEAAEYDQGDPEGKRKPGLYRGVADKPGMAGIPIRNVGDAGDNALACVEGVDLIKSFREYVREAELKEAGDLGADYCEKCHRENEQRDCTCPEPEDD